jgi:ATP/maltotriose-dependent transcriptional regulator MalT
MPVGEAARLELLPALAEALVETGDFTAARAFLDEALDGATSAGDELLLAHGQVVALLVEGHVHDPARWVEEAIAGVAHVLPVFRAAADDAGMAAAYRLLAWAHGTACQFGEVAAAADRATEHARRAGDDRQRRWASAQYAMAAVWGPTPVPEALAHCERIVEEAQGDRRTEGLVMSLLGRLEAMRGDFSRARALAREARAMLEDMGKSVISASTSLDSCGVEMLAGEPETAERDLRRDYEALEQMGEKYLLSTVAAELAAVLADQHRDEEAERYTAVAEELAADDDLTSQALWRWVRAEVLARRGKDAEAQKLAREATGLLDETDSLVAQADALLALAEVVDLGGRGEEALARTREALSLYEQKGDVVSAARARARAARLSGDANDSRPREVSGPAARTREVR